MLNLSLLIGRLNCGSKFGSSDLTRAYHREWLMSKVPGCRFFAKHRTPDKDRSFHVLNIVTLTRHIFNDTFTPESAI